MSASVEPGVEGSRAGCAHPRDERRTVGAEAGGQSGVGDGERAVPHAWRGEHGASHARGFGTDRRSQDDARALRYGRCAEAVGAALCPDADHADRADRRGDAVAGVFAGRDGGAVGSGARGVAGAEASLPGGLRRAEREGVLRQRAAGPWVGAAGAGGAGSAWDARRGCRGCGGGGAAWTDGRAAGDAGRDGVARVVAGGDRCGAGAEAGDGRGAASNAGYVQRPYTRGGGPPNSGSAQRPYTRREGPNSGYTQRPYMRRVGSNSGYAQRPYMRRGGANSGFAQRPYTRRDGEGSGGGGEGVGGPVGFASGAMRG